MKPPQTRRAPARDFALIALLLTLANCGPSVPLPRVVERRAPVLAPMRHASPALLRDTGRKLRMVEQIGNEDPTDRRWETPGTSLRLRAVVYGPGPTTQMVEIVNQGLKQSYEADIRDGVIRVNGRMVGLCLTNLTASRAGVLIQQHGEKIETVMWSGMGQFPASLVTLLAKLRTTRLLLTLNYGGAVADFTGLRPLKGHLYGLVLSGAVEDRSLKSLPLSGLKLLHLNALPITHKALAHVGRLRTLRVLELWKAPLTDAALAYLKHLKELRVLSLSESGITHRGLVHLMGLNRLGVLDLSRNNITDAGMRHLRPLSELVWLDLEGTKITDVGIAEVSGLKQLQVLNATLLPVTDSGVARLSKLRKLRGLNLLGVRLTDAVVPHLNRLPLESLGLGYPYSQRVNKLTAAVLRGLTGASRLRALRLAMKCDSSLLAALPRFVGLRSVDLIDCENKPQDLRHLSGLRHLRTITFAGVIGDTGMAHLGKLKQLRYLSLLDNETITDSGLRHLARLTQLRRLVLSSTAIKGSGLVHLKRLQKLNRLDLSSNSKLVDPGHRVLGALVGLYFLSLSSSKVTAKGLASLARLPNLRQLELGFSPITNKAVAIVSHCKQLRELSLLYSKITNDALPHLAQLRHLRKLDLSNTAIDDRGLKHLAKLRQLRGLSLSKTAISNAGLPKLYALVRLQHLKLRYTKLTPKSVALLKRALPSTDVRWCPPNKVNSALDGLFD